MLRNRYIGVVLITKAQAGRLRAGVVVLMHAVVVDDGDIAGLPVVADAVVNLVACTVKDVEGGLVDVPVLLRGAAGRVFLEVDVERLGAARHSGPRNGG